MMVSEQNESVFFERCDVDCDTRQRLDQQTNSATRSGTRRRRRRSRNTRICPLLLIRSSSWFVLLSIVLDISEFNTPFVVEDNEGNVINLRGEGGEGEGRKQRRQRQQRRRTNNNRSSYGGILGFISAVEAHSIQDALDDTWIKLTDMPCRMDGDCKIIGTGSKCLQLSNSGSRHPSSSSVAGAGAGAAVVSGSAGTNPNIGSSSSSGSSSTTTTPRSFGDGVCTASDYNPYTQGCLRSYILGDGGSDEEGSSPAAGQLSAASIEALRRYQEQYSIMTPSSSSGDTSTSITARKRVCNSEDPDNAAELGMCQTPDFPSYLEIRAFAADWESAIFNAWLLQIILSELLGVPTSVETGLQGNFANFYSSSSTFDYGDSLDLEALSTAIFNTTNLDCVEIANKNQVGLPGDYASCAHVAPEVWRAASYRATHDWISTKISDTALGVTALEGWFVPKFTVEAEPSVVSYIGLQGLGPNNRRKLADIFLRPTTWRVYCDEVSLTKCTVPDDIAHRAPENEQEDDRMYVDGQFVGYFRKTPEGDCDLYPDNCTGVLIDYPCGWTAYSEGQLYYYDIPLQVERYTYQQQIDVWHAANATRSHVIMQWWSPDFTKEKFAGTGAEFIQVVLPTPTQECLENRISDHDRCSTDIDVRRGTKIGSCGEPPKGLRKFLIKDLVDNSSLPDALQSPAFAALSSFSISEQQLSEMFVLWKALDTPRDAICRWFVDNLDYMQTFVPASYPRVKIEGGPLEALVFVSTTFGGLVTLMVLVTGYSVHRHRHRKVIAYSQIEFLFLLLAGSLTIAVGAIVTGATPSDGTCVATVWLINIGYTLELVPLIIKIAAINTLYKAAMHMRRVVLKRKALFRVVALITLMIIVYLAIWTGIDPPQETPEYELGGTPSSANSNDPTIVYVNAYCQSKYSFWQYLSVGWNVFLLLCATVIAIQTRNMTQAYNESQTLAFLIYSHFVFVLLRLVTFLLPLSQAVLLHFRSIIFSLDTLSTLAIYFLPKFLLLNTIEEPASEPMNPRFAHNYSTNNNHNVLLRWISSGIDLESSKEPDDNVSSPPGEILCPRTSGGSSEPIGSIGEENSGYSDDNMESSNHSHDTKNQL